MIDVNDIIPEDELIYCETCEEFVILTERYMMRSCKCTRTGAYGHYWVYYETGEEF